MAGNMVKQTGRDIEPKKDWYYNNKTHFQELDIILTKYNLKNKPEQIWNIDETGITLDHNPPKIVATKGERPSNQEKPKSRKERANVRTIKLLLSDVNKKVEQAVNKPQERKRKYVIPTCGAAITEDEFLEKLNEHKQEKEADKTVKTIPSMKTTNNKQ